jgi:hypothetical protein
MLTIMTRSSAISKTERDLAFMRKYPFNKFDSSGLWDKTALPERRRIMLSNANAFGNADYK